MSHLVLLAVVGAVLLLLAAASVFARRRPDPIARLKRQFVKLSRLPRGQAEDELMDRIDALALRYPGKSYAWYLQWLVTDLERAKR